MIWLFNSFFFSKMKKMVKASTGEKIKTSTTGNDKLQKRLSKSNWSNHPEKDCKNENGDNEKVFFLTKNVEWLD